MRRWLSRYMSWVPETDLAPESRVVHVVHEDIEKGGRKLLHAYGYKWAAARVSAACGEEYTVEQARVDENRGKFKLSRPESVIAWALTRAGKHKAAAAVRALTREDD